MIFNFKGYWSDRHGNAKWDTELRAEAENAAEACEREVVAHLTAPMDCGHPKAELMSTILTDNLDEGPPLYECRACADREQYGQRVAEHLLNKTIAMEDGWEVRTSSIKALYQRIPDLLREVDREKD